MSTEKKNNKYIDADSLFFVIDYTNKTHIYKSITILLNHYALKTNENRQSHTVK
jgi:hypothetical protein